MLVQSKKNLMIMYAGKVVYRDHVERKMCDTTENLIVVK